MSTIESSEMVSVSTVTNTSSLSEEAKEKKQREGRLFPFFSDISRFAHFPPLIYMIFFMLTTVQNIGGLSWYGSQRFWKETNTICDIIYAFNDWTVYRRTWDQAMLIMISGFILFAFEIGWYLFVIADYKQRHTFKKWHLVVSRLFYTLLLGYLGPVFFAFLGRSLAELIENPCPSSIAYSICYIVIAPLSFFIYYYAYSFTVCSPILIHASNSTFDNNCLPLMQLDVIISVLFSRVLDFFPLWITVFTWLVIWGIFLYITRRGFYFPSYDLLSNAGLAQSSFGSIVSFIIEFISVYIGVPWYLKLFIPPIVGTSCTFPILSILKKKSKKLIDTLNSKEIPMTEAEKAEYFDAMVFSSSDEVIMYLRVGLVNHCDFIVDFSFQRYLIANYAEIDIIYMIAKIAALFPSELQFFTYCLGILGKINSKKSIIEEFDEYQMNRVHVTRQDATSKEVVSSLSHLKRVADKSIGTVRHFWKEIYQQKGVATITSLIDLYHVVEEAEAAFIDATERFPNNKDVAGQYAKFLTEAKGNYEESIRWMRRSIAINEGRRQPMDYAFKSLVNAFPSYLYDGILDVCGCVCTQQAELGSTSQSMSSSCSSLSSSSEQLDELDFKNEELISKNISDGKNRFFVQNLFSNMKIKGISSAYVFLIASFIVSVIALIVEYVVVPTIAAEGVADADQMYAAGYVLQNVKSCGLLAAYKSAEILSLSAGNSYIDSTLNSHITESFLATYTVKNFEKMNQFSIYSFQQLPVFLKCLVQQGSLIDSQTQEIHTFMTNFTTIDTAGAKQNKVIPFRAALIEYFDICRSIYAFHETQNPETTELPSLLQTIAYNSLIMQENINHILEVESNIGETISSHMKMLSNVLSIILTIVVGLVNLIAGVYSLYEFYQDSKRMSEAIASIPEDVIDESIKPIWKETKDSFATGSMMTSIRKSIVTSLRYLITILVIVVPTVFVFLAGYQDTKIEEIKNVQKWITQFVARQNYYIQPLTAFISGIEGVITKEEAQDYINEAITQLNDLHSKIIIGITGYDDSIDNFQLSDQCESDSTLGIENFLRCSSINKQIIQIQLQSNDMLKQYDAAKAVPTIDIEPVAKSLYVLDSGLHERNFVAGLTIRNAYKASCNKIESDCQFYFLIGLCCSLVLYVLLYIFASLPRKAFEMAKILLSLLPPHAVLGNKTVLTFVKGGHSDENNDKTLVESIVECSSTAVIITNSSGIIQSINPSVTKMTGYQMDSLLGRPIGWLTSQQDDESTTGTSTMSTTSMSQDFKKVILSKAFTLLRQNPDEVKVEGTLEINTNKEEFVVAHVTIVPVRRQREVESYIIIINDLTNEINQKKEMQVSKARVNKILASLIPPEAMPFVRKQENAFFETELATVIEIEMDGINDLVSVMPPSQLMNALDTIYEKFDDIIRLYPAVKRMKTNDNLFVACCGLFDFKDDYEAQAEQAVKCSYEILKSVPSINEALSTSLSLRIGVNMGGPLVGVIINPQTPCFDLFGAPIGMAVKMVNEGQPMKLQVSEVMLRYLDPTKFKTEPGAVLIGYYSKARHQVYNVVSIN